MIQYYAPSYNKYSDDENTLNGAYGPRIKKCLPQIIDLLQSDPDTRRAVISIYCENNAGLDSKDIPCTLNFHFLIRIKVLSTFVMMMRKFYDFLIQLTVVNFRNLAKTLFKIKFVCYNEKGNFYNYFFL